MNDIIVAAISLIVGAAFSWWVGYRLHKVRMDKPYTELRACQQQLEERVREVLMLRNENENITSSLRAEAERRAIAETRASRIEGLQRELDQRERSLTELMTKNTELETRSVEEKKAAEEKLQLINGAQAALSDAFKALSFEALKSNNQSFLELARTTFEKLHEASRADLSSRQKAIDELVRPLKESLVNVDSKLAELEKDRIKAYSALHEQLSGLLEIHLPSLRHETENLVRALRQPTVRGRWGEIQLRRVVELAGMVDHCDFFEQESVSAGDGRLRPDMIVRLPGDKQIVVDAKAPVKVYLDALEANSEDAQRVALSQYAAQVRAHIASLGRKAYWEQFDRTPDFAVLFLPGEMFFSAALQQDPALIEFGVNEKVIPATPTTLIALLRAVSYGWRQEALTKNAQEICQLGNELYKRLADVSHYWTDLGKKLGGAVDSFNRATGSLESRVLVSARRFQNLQAAPSGVDIELQQPLERSTRSLQTPELGDSK